MWEDWHGHEASSWPISLRRRIMGKMVNFMTQLANNVPMVGSFVLVCIQHKINSSRLMSYVWSLSEDAGSWPGVKLKRAVNFSLAKKPPIFPSHSHSANFGFLNPDWLKAWIWPRFWQDCWCWASCRWYLLSIAWITRISRIRGEQT